MGAHPQASHDLAVPGAGGLCLPAHGTSVAPSRLDGMPDARCGAHVPHKLEANVDYEIEVEELKHRKIGVGRIVLAALATCVLAVVLRHLL